MVNEAQYIPSMNPIMMTLRADSSVYRIEDYDCGHAVLSKTFLHQGQETRGHQHNLSECYYFIKGTGEMDIGIESIHVEPGIVTVVPPDVFHRVRNLAQGDLEFICIWNKVMSKNGIEINSNKQVTKTPPNRSRLT
jgi:mannose-6-phosphate isomerase-like protein (cupin superfamily)